MCNHYSVEAIVYTPVDRHALDQIFLSVLQVLSNNYLLALRSLIESVPRTNQIQAMSVKLFVQGNHGGLCWGSNSRLIDVVPYAQNSPRRPLMNLVYSLDTIEDVKGHVNDILYDHEHNSY